MKGSAYTPTCHPKIPSEVGAEGVVGNSAVAS